MTVPIVFRIAAILLGIAGLSTIVEDMTSLFSNMVDVAKDNWIGATLIAVAIVLFAYSYKDNIVSAFGFRSDRRLVELLTEWLHQHHGYALLETTRNKKGLILVTEFQKRRIILTKLRKSSTLTVSAGLHPSPDDAKVLQKDRCPFAEVSVKIWPSSLLKWGLL